MAHGETGAKRPRDAKEYRIWNMPNDNTVIFAFPLS